MIVLCAYLIKSQCSCGVLSCVIDHFFAGKDYRFAFQLTHRTTAKRLRIEGNLQVDHALASNAAVLDFIIVFHQCEHRNHGGHGNVRHVRRLTVFEENLPVCKRDDL